MSDPKDDDGEWIVGLGALVFLFIVALVMLGAFVFTVRCAWRAVG